MGTFLETVFDSLLSNTLLQNLQFSKDPLIKVFVKNYFN